MENEKLEALDQLAELLQQSSTFIISEFALWFLVSSVTWVTVGFVLMLISWKWKTPKRLQGKNPDELELGAYFISRALLFGAGLVFIAANVPTVLSPTARGISHLLTKIAGL